MERLLELLTLFHSLLTNQNLIIEPIVRLNFTCNRNWEDMTPVAGGRFCNDCQKKVVDFTDKTNDEIAAYIMSNTTKVCGRFQQSQLVSAATKPVWKRLLSAAMFAAVFIGIKEASAQNNNLPDSSKSQKRNFNNALGGEIVLVSYNIPSTSAPAQKIYAFNEVDAIPSFPAGEKAFMAYLRKNVPAAAKADANGIASFMVDKYGNVINVTIVKSANASTDAEAVKAFQKSPKWKPGIKNGEAVAVKLVLPFSFTKKIMEKYKH